MKRRRIREIVAAALTDYCGERVTAAEVGAARRRGSGFEISLPGVLAVGAWSKRDAVVAMLGQHGWGRPWPRLLPTEQYHAREGLTLDVLARHPLDPWRSASDRMAHLREPVALPEEAPRG